jgi:polysaccharide export outer membrane protein
MINRLKALCLSSDSRSLPRWFFVVSCVFGLMLMAAASGCRTAGEEPRFKDVKELTNRSPDIHITNDLSALSPTGNGSSGTATNDSIVLREGDLLKITFLGAPHLNISPMIRPDGKISLYLVGEIKAAGLTPIELEKEIKEKYKGQVLVSEVMVSVEGQNLTVYVTGAVLHPQKVVSNHPITALEAVMEAGGPDFTKANLKAVSVIRQERGRTQKFILNLKDVLSGKSNEQFYLKNGDIIYVREKFSVF